MGVAWDQSSHSSIFSLAVSNLFFFLSFIYLFERERMWVGGGAEEEGEKENL